MLISKCRSDDILQEVRQARRNRESQTGHSQVRYVITHSVAKSGNLGLIGGAIGHEYPTMNGFAANVDPGVLNTFRTSLNSGDSDIDYIGEKIGLCAALSI